MPVSSTGTVVTSQSSMSWSQRRGDAIEFGSAVVHTTCGRSWSTYMEEKAVAPPPMLFVKCSCSLARAIVTAPCMMLMLGASQGLQGGGMRAA